MKKIFTLSMGFMSCFSSHTQVVISQLYGGGGNTGATYRNDFIELFNPTPAPINISGYGLQYASATGTSWQITTLPAGSIINSNAYFLIQGAAGTNTTTPALPVPDATGTFNLAAASGKVALTSSITVLTGACPTGGTIVDFVGYGTTANCFLGAGPAPGASNNTSASIRKNNGLTNTSNNAADFVIGTPVPRNVLLPLKLLSFTASIQGNGVAINWRTAGEQNTSHFDVEQSFNGSDFKKMASIVAAGNTTVEKNYSLHGVLNTATTYYRLKMVDADGRSTTSAIVKITPSKNGFSLGNVYPLPAKNNLVIEWNSKQAGATTIVLTDIVGRTIRTVNVQTTMGFNQYLLHIEWLASGQYFLQLKKEGNLVQTVIIKQ